MSVKNARAEESALLRVYDWNRCFENSRTRQVDALTWVRLPVKSDSDGYVRFIEMDDPLKSLAMFGAWTALVKVAARCKPRGVLVRDGTIPLTASDLARRSNMGHDFAPLFKEMMERAKGVGWLISLTKEETERLRKGEPLEATVEPENDQPDDVDRPEKTSPDGQADATQPSPGRHLGVSRASPGRQSGVSQVTPEHHSVGGNGKLTREDFESIWGLFPKARRMDREKCFDLCSAHVKAGRSVVALREATTRYAQAILDAETPPKYIQLAKTFYGASGRVLDAMEPDFAARYVEGSKGEAKASAKFKPGESWGLVYGEECKIMKHPHSGRMEYWSHNDWHELPPGIKIHTVPKA